MAFEWLKINNSEGLRAENKKPKWLQKKLETANFAFFSSEINLGYLQSTLFCPATGFEPVKYPFLPWRKLLKQKRMLFYERDSSGAQKVSFLNPAIAFEGKKYTFFLPDVSLDEKVYFLRSSFLDFDENSKKSEVLQIPFLTKFGCKNVTLPKKKTMHFISEELENYIAQHSQNEPELLAALNRETHQKVLQPRMLSGHFQGRVLSMLSKLIRPMHILEIGTYTGYATLCLCEGMQKNGSIDTIDINEELASIQKKYFDLSSWNTQIIQHIGDAMEIIPTLEKKYDLVFIDADKENYLNYFDLIVPLMNEGGIILSDNVLWSGKVLETPDPRDLSTNILLEYNKKINEDPRVETVLLPIRDGLTVSRVL